MKIETTQPSRSVEKKSLKKNSKASGFSEAVGNADFLSDPLPLQSVDMAADISSILALQELHVDAKATKQALQEGHDLLDQLDKVRVGILTGCLSKESLEKIAASAETRQIENLDPKLKNILDDIHLRAQVELAKIEQSLKSK